MSVSPTATSRGRRADLRVTEEGAQVLAAAEAAIRAVDDDLLAGFGEAERAQLGAALLSLFTARPAVGDPDTGAPNRPGGTGSVAGLP